jgi:hypothetical protein
VSATLTPKQAEVLRAIHAQSRGHRERQWLRPMDIGARDASHHSATMKRLAAKGLLDREPRNTLTNVYQLGSRGSYVYRITKAGLAAARGPGSGGGRDGR